MVTIGEKPDRRANWMAASGASVLVDLRRQLERVARTVLAHGTSSSEHQNWFPSVLSPTALEPRWRQPSGRSSRVLVVQWERGGGDSTQNSSSILE